MVIDERAVRTNDLAAHASTTSASGLVEVVVWRDVREVVVVGRAVERCLSLGFFFSIEFVSALSEEESKRERPPTLSCGLDKLHER